MSSLALHSGDYVERYNSKPLDRVRALARRMDIPETAELADFACGNGMLAQVVGDRAGVLHGIDFSSDFIAAARGWADRSGLRNCRFYCEDILDFCARNQGRFDRAATLDFSEHVRDEEAIPIYAAIRSALKPGAKLYLHSPNLDFFVERLKDVGLMRQFPEHVAVRNAVQTRAMLAQAGFDPDGIKVSYIPHYNVLKLVHGLGRLPLIGRYFQARLWVEATA